MRNLFLTAALMLCSALPTFGQSTGIASEKTIVVVDSEQNPIPAASVSNFKGVSVTMTNDFGHATVAEKDYSLTVKALGFKNTVVTIESDTVVMPWKIYELDEVVVNSHARPIERIVCYVRENSGVIADGDTTSLRWEGMVDYMIPVGKTKQKGHDKPRVLNSRFSLTSTAQSVDTTGIVEHFTFYNLIRYPRNKVNESQKLASMESGNDTVKVSKLGLVEEVHGKTPAGYRVYKDFLADKKEHVWSPGIFKLIGATIDFHELAITRLYGAEDSGVYQPHDLMAMSATLHLTGRGKMLRFAFNSKGDTDIFSHIEVYPVEITFLTEEEVKEIKKEKPDQQFVLPSIIE